MGDHNQVWGDRGENVALSFLVKKGFVPVASRYRTKWGEIDHIFRDRQTLVFVEVKCRQDLSRGDPEEAIGPMKQQHLVRAALSYLQNQGLSDMLIRFDVLSIGPEGIRHLPDAFSYEGDYYY